jgi:galactokinase
MPPSATTDLIDRTRAEFRRAFGHDPALLSVGPGRANVIGEHTDYHGGFVLPFAVDRVVVAALGPAAGGRFRIHSLDFDAVYTGPLPSPSAPLAIASDWTGYAAGVVNELSLLERAPEGFSAVIAGNVPIGSGMSSSAAFEVALLQGLDALFELGLTRWQLVTTAQACENRWFSVRSGLMDQFASVFGVDGSALFLDNATKAWSPVTLAADVDWVLVDSGVARRLAASGYNTRRAEGEAALAKLVPAGLARACLSDLAPADLDRALSLLTPTEAKRTRHVVDENQRVLAAIGALALGRADDLGRLLDASHASLRDLYEVSVAPLDALVELLRGLPSALGARLMGAGFGGSVIAVGRPGFAAEVPSVAPQYTERTGHHLAVHPAHPAPGARILAA